MPTKKKLKHRNPVAMDLRTPKYRKRVTKDRTKYDRKARFKMDREDVEGVLRVYGRGPNVS